MVRLVAIALVLLEQAVELGLELGVRRGDVGRLVIAPMPKGTVSRGVTRPPLPSGRRPMSHLNCEPSRSWPKYWLSCMYMPSRPVSQAALADSFMSVGEGAT